MKKQYRLELFTADGKYIIKNAEGEVVDAEPSVLEEARNKLNKLLGVEKEMPKPKKAKKVKKEKKVEKNVRKTDMDA
jgi:hypothetical protein